MPLDVDHTAPGAGAPDAIARVLRLAGPRPGVPEARRARVQAAVRAGWKAGVRRRTTRRRFVFWGALGTAACLLVVARLTLENRSRQIVGDPVAVVERLEGAASRTAVSPGKLSVNDAVRSGEWIETDARARLALRFFDGTSVRVDAGSRARPLSPGVLELVRGAVYVDTGRESGRFEVRTEMAVARDIGTQFEVRLLDRALRLRVRTGAVELSDASRSVSGRGGTEVVFSDSGAVTRPFSAHGPEWDWTAQIAPGVEIEGLSLAAYLEHLSREHGWTLRYADPALARDASAVALHGSVKNLSPREALDVVVATSGLSHRLEDGILTVSRESSSR